MKIFRKYLFSKAGLYWAKLFFVDDQKMRPRGYKNPHHKPKTTVPWL